MKKILFVCRQNVFRSLSAELLLKKYLRDNKIRGWSVSSAGIQAKPELVHKSVYDALKEHGIKSFSHKQTKVTKRLLLEQDVIIAMAVEHRETLRKKFGIKNVVLFDELAIKKESSVLDIEYVFEHPSLEDEEVNRFIKRTIHFIHEKTPAVYTAIQDRVFLFEDFVKKKRKHRNGFPFVALCETSQAVAFMSLDVPYSKDGHFLVIPKKRYENFLDIPAHTLTSMMACVRKLGRAIEQKHDGFNILLNNSSAAGQYIFHAHMHIIPRDFDDGILIELWKKQKISSSEFKKLNSFWKKKLLEQK